MSIGTGTYIDNLLAEYLPPEEANQGLIGELFEDETNALLYAVLVELRGTGRGAAEDDDAEASYHAASDLAVTTEEDTEEWGFAAETVIVWGAGSDITVALKGPNTENREIPLSPGDMPFSIAGVSGVGTSKLWYSRPDSSSDTTINVIAL